MSSRTVLRASIAALCGVSASFATGSAWAQEPDKDAAGEEMGVITVTGSRTITDVLKSPTPITSVDIGELGAHHAERHGRRAEQAAQHHGRTHAAQPGQRQHQ